MDRYPPKYPTEFYVVHHLFSRVAFPHGPVWGSLSDGPTDRDEAMQELRDLREPLTLETLKVWHFQPDVPARDVTEDFIAEIMAEHEPTEEELAEQADCDRGDDAAHYAREVAA